jgi:hypothetical protein
VSLGLKDLLSLDVAQLADDTIVWATNLPRLVDNRARLWTQRANEKTIEIPIERQVWLQGLRHIHIVTVHEAANDEPEERKMPTSGTPLHHSRQQMVRKQE